MKNKVTKILLLPSCLLAMAIFNAALGQDAAIPNSSIKVISFEPFNYPAVAATAHVQGAVVVKAQLDDHGKVAGATAISGPDLLLRASVEDVKKWQFEPNAQKTAVIVFLFRIEGICHENAFSSQFIFDPPNIATVTACGMTVQE